MGVGMGLGQSGICALLMVQELGARLESPVAAQAGEGGQLGRVRAACSSGGGGGRGRGTLSVCSFILLLGLARFGVGTTSRVAGFIQ